MWLIFGLLAIIATIINLYLYKTEKNYYLAMGMALSFTTLTLTASYNMVASWLKVEDWSALLDVIPTMNRVFWILSILSILINISPVLLELKKKN